MSSIIRLLKEDQYRPQYTILEEQKRARGVWFPMNQCNFYCAFILLGIAAMVFVVSLIPVYLSERPAYNSTPCRVVLAASYGTNFQNKNSLTVANINAVASTLMKAYNFNQLSINSITFMPSSTIKTFRKRRQTQLSVKQCQKNTGTTGDVLTIVFTVTYPSACLTVSSKNIVLATDYAKLQTTNYNLNLQLTSTNDQTQNVETFFCIVGTTNSTLQSGNLAVQQQSPVIFEDPSSTASQQTTIFSGEPSIDSAESTHPKTGQPSTTPAEPTTTITGQPTTAPAEPTTTITGQPTTAPAEPTTTITGQPTTAPAEPRTTITGQPTTSITTDITSTIAMCTSTTCSIRGNCYKTVNGPYCNCTTNLYGAGQREVFTTSGDMTDNPTGTDTTLGAPYIDAISISARGLVTTVSFYANNGCNDNTIRFGAFKALNNLSTSTEFELVSQSGVISVDRSGSSSAMERVDISLCILSNTPSGCQANAFVIEQGQYFGSYASQCRFGYSPLVSSVYPRSYYRYTYNPFTSANPTATYVNDFNNVVLQQITIAELTTENCDTPCEQNPCDTNAICTSTSATAYSCTCQQGFTGSGAEGDCTAIYVTTTQGCSTATQFGYAASPNNLNAAVGTTYIDAVAANIGGLVTQVSFYASKQCQDNNIYFGAFSAVTAISTSTEFDLTAESDPLSVDLSSSSDTSMQLVTISLCISSSNPVGCQGQAFTISSGQYFGSYAPQCIMGYTGVSSSSIYPSTYYQSSSNPFPSGTQTTATYSNSYPNVVLQYATAQPTDSCT